MLRSEQPKERSNDRAPGQPVFHEREPAESVLVVRSHPHPPPQERPPSARRASLARQRFSRGSSGSIGITPSPQTSRVPSPTEQRPLSRYRVLPSISRRSSGISDDAYLDPGSPSPPIPTGDRPLASPPPYNDLFQQQYKQQQQQHQQHRPMPSPRKSAAPVDDPGTALNLALRLPDGRRVQADFNSQQSLDSLLAFALDQMALASSGDEQQVPGLAEARRQFELLSAAERTVLQDWNASLEELGVPDRSLYILQESE